MPTTEERINSLETVQNQSQSAEQLENIDNYDVNTYHLIYDPSAGKIVKMKGSLLPLGSHKPYPTVASLPDPTDPNSSTFVAFVHSDTNPITETTGDGFYVVENDNWVKKDSEVENEVNKANTTKGVSGEAVYFLNANKVFNSYSSWTSSEKTIVEAILDVKIWGANVNPSENYYLARIAYKRTTYNDLFIRIQRSDGTIIAFIQLPWSSEHTGVKTYRISYLAGYECEITIDWNNIPDNFSYSSGDYTRMGFNERVYTVSSEKSQKGSVIKEVGVGVDPEDALQKQQIEALISNAISNIDEDTLNLNAGNLYPISSTSPVLPTGSDLQKTKDFLLNVTILNASANSEYRLAYVGKNQATYKDTIAIYEYEKGTNTKIRDVISLSSLLEFGDVSGIQYIELSATSLSDYSNIDFPNGLTFLMLVNWDAISDDRLNLTTEDVRFHDNCIKSFYNTNSSNTENSFLLADNLVYKPDEDNVYIASKWDENYDLVIHFRKDMFNQLMTFSKVSLKANTSLEISKNLERSDSIVLNNVDSDNIGPYIIVGGSGWVGGNHGIEGSFVNLSSNYNVGDGMINVVDGTQFVASGGQGRTGGAAGYLKFNYTSVVGNQLQGVTWETSEPILTTSNQIQIYHRTAETDSYKFYVDGKEIPTGTVVEARELQVVVRNKIYDNTTLNMTSGAMDLAFYEDVFYRVNKGNIEVMLENLFQKTIDLNTYHGMQLLNANWQDKVYLANAQNTSIIDKTTYPGSGDPFTYQCDKMIVSNEDFSINCAMFFDPNCSYAQNKVNYLDATDYLWKAQSNNKLYHGTILKQVRFNNGDNEWWRGVYTFFKNPTLQNASFAYPLIIKGKEHLAFDFHGAGNERINIPDFHSTECIKIKEDTNIIIDTNIKPSGLDVMAKGYGEGLVKLNK